jgi:hypothetical protein
MLLACGLVYLRESRRTNRDGSVVRYLQLAHNERHPWTGNSVAKVIHNFGRAEQVDRDGLARLVASISRFLTPEQAAAAAGGGEVEVLDSRRLGGAWTLDRLWERLGIDAAIRAAAAGRRLDGEAAERVVFALVAQRALEPDSKLAATRWVAERVAIGPRRGRETPSRRGFGAPHRRRGGTGRTARPSCCSAISPAAQQTFGSC